MVACVLVMIAAIFVSSTFLLLAPPSTVNCAPQVRVSVVQVQGAISGAYSGHLHAIGVNCVVEITVPSVHFAAVASDPKLMKLCLFDDDHQQTRLPQLVAVQSHDDVLKMSMNDAESVKAVRTGSNAACVIIAIIGLSYPTSLCSKFQSTNL